jgi:hypothetical protein
MFKFSKKFVAHGEEKYGAKLGHLGCIAIEFIWR